jgi:hypothetical protein
VTHRTSAGTHDATDDARVMRMVRMVGRREHGETFVKRKHFYLFCLVWFFKFANQSIIRLLLVHTGSIPNVVAVVVCTMHNHKSQPPDCGAKQKNWNEELSKFPLTFEFIQKKKLNQVELIFFRGLNWEKNYKVDFHTQKNHNKEIGWADELRGWRWTNNCESWDVRPIGMLPTTVHARLDMNCAAQSLAYTLLIPPSITHTRSHLPLVTTTTPLNPPRISLGGSFLSMSEPHVLFFIFSSSSILFFYFFGWE